LTAAGLLAAVSIMLVGGPALADPPNPPPAASSPQSGNKAPVAPPGSITWSVQPSDGHGADHRSTFTYNNIKPLTVINDYFAVTNFSKQPVTFQLYAADAFTTTSGNLDLVAKAQKSTDVGSWVTFDKSQITLKPNEQANEPFKLTVPKNGGPGDHAGGIIAAVSVTVPNGDKGKVTVDRRLGVPIFLRVAGPLHPTVAVESLSTGGYNGTWNPFGGGGTSVSYTIHNTGNVRLNVAQDVTATGPFGITLASAHPTTLKQLLPGATIRVNQHLSGVFPAGPSNTKVQLTPRQIVGIPAAKPAPAAVPVSAGFLATPWPQLLLIILLVGLGFGIRWYLKWRKRHQSDVIEAAVAKAKRETVEQLTRGGTQTVGASAGGASTNGGQEGSGGSA